MGYTNMTFCSEFLSNHFHGNENRHAPWAEITLELDGIGDSDFARVERELCFYVSGQAKKACKDGTPVILFSMQGGVVGYASNSAHGVVSGVNKILVLSTFKHPVFHADLSDHAWRETVELLATEIGQQFKQVKFTMNFTERHVVVFNRVLPDDDESPLLFSEPSALSV